MRLPSPNHAALTKLVKGGGGNSASEWEMSDTSFVQPPVPFRTRLPYLSWKYSYPRRSSDQNQESPASDPALLSGCYVACVGIINKTCRSLRQQDHEGMLCPPGGPSSTSLPRSRRSREIPRGPSSTESRGMREAVRLGHDLPEPADGTSPVPRNKPAI